MDDSQASSKSSSFGQSSQSTSTHETSGEKQFPEHRTFISAAETICASVHDIGTEHITTHDLLDAYATLNVGLKFSISENRPQDVYAIGLPESRIKRSQLILALRRDILSSIRGPTHPHDAAGDGMTEEELASVRDVARLCQHALCLVSGIFKFPSLHDLFKEKQLDSLFQIVLKVLLTHPLPTPNPSRTYGLLLLVLQTQQLSSSLVTPHLGKILQVVEYAMKGTYKTTSVTYGLKLIATFMRAPRRELQNRLDPYYERCLSLLLSTDPLHRFYAAEALSSFALAKQRSHFDKNQTTHFRKALSSFLSHSPDLIDLLKKALSPTQMSLFEGSQWAMVTIASVTILLDAFASTKMNWPESVIKLLQVPHPLTPLVWNCMIWCYARVREHPIAGGGFDIVRHSARLGNGCALIAVLLRTKATQDNNSSLKEAISVLQSMVVQDDKEIRRSGVEVLAKLMREGGDQRVVPLEAEKSAFLLEESLFDGKILYTRPECLAEVMEGIKPVGLVHIRSLTDLEIENNWDDLFDVWYKAVMKGMCDLEPEIRWETYYDMWQRLLLAESDLTQHRGHVTVPEPYLKHILDVLKKFASIPTSSLENKASHLVLLQNLWNTLHNVFPANHLKTTSRNFLKAVVTQEFRFEDETIRPHWLKLCHALVHNRRPEKHFDFSKSWKSVVKVMIELGQKDRERYLSCLRLPLILSFEGEGHHHPWEALLSHTLQAYTFASLPTSPAALWDFICPEGCNPSSHPQLVYYTFLYFSKNNQTFTTTAEDCRLVERILSDLHPALVSQDASLRNSILKVALIFLQTMRALIARTPDRNVVSTLFSCSSSLDPWFKDVDKYIADDDYMTFVVPLYCEIIQQLDKFDPSLDILKTLQDLWVGPLLRSSPPKLAVTQFADFWRRRYQSHTAEYYPYFSDDLKFVLRILDDVLNNGFTTGFSQTDSQMDSSHIVPETIPLELSPRRPNQTQVTRLESSPINPAPTTPRRKANPTSDPYLIPESPEINTHPSPRNSATPNPAPRTKKRKIDEASDASGSETSSKRRKALVIDCVELPPSIHRTHGTKRSRESQLMTPASSSGSWLHARQPVEDEHGFENEDEYDWDSGNVSQTDLKDVLQDDGSLQHAFGLERNRGDDVEETTYDSPRPAKTPRRESQYSDPTASPSSSRKTSRVRTATGTEMLSALNRVATTLDSASEHPSTQELLDMEERAAAIVQGIKRRLEARNR